MTMEEQRVARLENLRRARAHRLHAVMKYISDDTEARDHALYPMQQAAPHPYTDELDPDHFATLGKTFESVSVINEESIYRDVPSCPRYQEIRAYLLANRAQGRLCLDTMSFYIPVYTLLHYIEDFGGLAITPEEWITFLITCADRSEMFLYDSIGKGRLRWIEPNPPIDMPIHPHTPAPPPPPHEQLFRELCLSDNRWLDRGFADFDFWYLLRALQLKAGVAWLHPQLLFDLVSWHELHGDLWCWGPNRIIRKKVASWPSPLSSPVISDFGSFSDDSDSE